MKAVKPAGVILSGGRSSRMGVARKALLELGDKTLLAHVSDRVQPYLEPLMLSCESETSDFDEYGLTVVADLLPGFRGPLTGLYSALFYLHEHGHDNGLVLCPCDAPFIPVNLVETLQQASQAENPGQVVVISYQGILQPTFSLWKNQHLPVIREAMLGAGMGGIKQVLSLLPFTVVEWPLNEPSPFFNVNTIEDLQTAATWLDRGRV